MTNRVCNTLGIRYPVVQGAMAWCSNHELVAAVSNAGGLGVLGVGFAPPEVIRDEVAKVRELTDKPFGANIFMIPDMLKVTSPLFVELAPPVLYVDILANLDMDMAKHHFKLWHDAGIKIVFKASFISDAVKAQEAGADVIIVKGWEGGGHVTDESTMVLVPQAAELITVPLVASGGIADGRGMAAGIVLGAQGCEMGSAFLLAEENNLHPDFKQKVIETGDMGTTITGLSTGEPSRMITNTLSKRILQVEAENLRAEAAKMVADMSAGSLRRGATTGDLEEGAVMIGQIVPLLRKIRPAKEIIESTVNECEAILARQMTLGL